MRRVGSIGHIDSDPYKRELQTNKQTKNMKTIVGTNIPDVWNLMVIADVDCSGAQAAVGDDRELHEGVADGCAGINSLCQEPAAATTAHQ